MILRLGFFTQSNAHGFACPNEPGHDIEVCQRKTISEICDHERAIKRFDEDRQPQKLAWIVTFSYAVFGLGCPGWERHCQAGYHFRTAYVIDGDTLVIRKRHIRLFGVDAFERDQTCGRFRCGIEARRVLNDLTRRQNISCEKRDIDTYGRLVAICKSSSGVDLGGEMVRRGLAVAYRRFSTKYLGDESYAKSRHAGAWAYGFESPLQYRRKSSNYR